MRQAFGLPGGEILEFMDACRRVGIRVLLTGHETSAAWMAQVTGQITGTPGLCFSTLGPGATNLVTGVAGAFLERAPMVAVVAQIPRSTRSTATHQRLDLEAVFTNITKRTSEVGIGRTCELAKQCMELAAAPRPGPTVLVLPSDIAKQEPSPEPSSKSSLWRVVKNDNDTEESIKKIRNRISASHRPLVLVGLGAEVLAAPEIRKFVNTLQAPFLVTPKAKGILPEDHPLFLGVASGVAVDSDILSTVREADLIIGIGFDPVEVDGTWFTAVNMVSIDSVSMAEGSYRPLEAIGNIRSLVTKLTENIAEPHPWPKDLLSTRRKVLLRSPGSTGDNASPLGIIQGLREVFPRSGTVTCDVGSHKLVMGQFWRSYEPGTFLMSNGLSGMGFGIPAAIAAAVCDRDRPVMAVVGDGGMLMMVHDLAIIREMNLPIVIVVLKDDSLSLIRIAQKRKGYPLCGVDFKAPDFVKIAEGFGLRAERAKSVTQAQSAVRAALSRRGAALIEIPVDIGEYYDLV